MQKKQRNGVAELIPPSPEVRQFAEKHDVRAKRDECGELIIPGAAGDVYEHGDGRFGVLLMFKTRMQWTFAKKKLTNAGFTISQNADTEGTALFDPADREQSRLALKMARVPRQRRLTDEQRLAASDRMRRVAALRKPQLKMAPLTLETMDAPRIEDECEICPEPLFVGESGMAGLDEGAI